MPNRALYRLIWIPSGIAILGMSAFFASQPAAVPLPGTMKSFVSIDNYIHLKRPGNWRAMQLSSHAIDSSIEFEPARNTHMRISSDLQGSLMSDIAKSADNTLSSIPGIGSDILAKQKTPLERLHDMQAKDLKKNKREYEMFQDGTTKDLQVGGYPSKITDFTYEAPGVFGVIPMTGKRITTLAGERRVSILYSCPKESKKLIMPVFDEMRDSMKFGEGTGG